MDPTPVAGTSLFGRARASLAYVPGLDGLRAIAVAAVVLYHAQQNMPSSWMPGGFLGVEVFFVISGYLITTLLVAEHERTDRIDIKQFWARRARRLLPALFAVLIVTMGIVGIGGSSSDSLREHVRAFRGTWVSAWLYLTNWYQVIAGLEYSDRLGRPSLLRHLWSLAVEEQFYLVWPIVMWFVLRRFRHRLPAVGVVFAALAGAIALVVALVYRSENLGRINFLYLSTPTRLSGLLLGSALAIFWRPWRLATASVSRHGRWTDVAGTVGLGVLVWAFLRWHLVVDGVSAVHGYNLLFRGGFLIIGIATVMTIVAVTHPGSLLASRVLSARPLVWVGKRSYGLYLWHWPVFQLTRPRGDLSLLDPSSPDVRWGWLPALVLRLLITVVLTELSYRLLEVPVRSGLGYARSRVLAAVAAVAMLVTVVPTASSFAAADVLADQAACNRDPAACEMLGTDTEPAAAPTTTAEVPATIGVPTSAPPAASPTNASLVPLTTMVPAPTTTMTKPVATLQGGTPPPAPAAVTVPLMPIKPLALGDSVMLGAKGRLEAAGIRVDAGEARRFGKAEGLIDRYRASGQLGEVVVLALGGNDNLSARLIDVILGKLTGVDHVIVVTPQVNGLPKEARNHRLLLAARDRFPNVTILDWQRLTQSKLRYYWGAKGVSSPGRAYFWADRIHLAPAGQRYFTSLIVGAITKAVG
ncbi:unannotated protein [freshwater metagenome]|uniref:Unannotated protein n=1 Tax=freshwater metagenome TaxID=449393 RepID=A0A6J6TED8_9ZZZZ